MKKILGFICLIVLILTITSSVWAEGSIGIDYIPGGSDNMASGENFIDFSGSTQTGKFISYFATGDFVINNFKLGASYGSGTDDFKPGTFITTNRKYDFTMWEYRLGARVLDTERVKLDVMVSQLQLQLKNVDNWVFQNGLMLGCDVNWLITEKLNLDGSCGYSLFGATYEESGTSYDPAYMLALRMRLSYGISDHFAFSLGFREDGAYVNGYPSSSGSLWRGLGGFSLGAKYTF